MEMGETNKITYMFDAIMKMKRLLIAKGICSHQKYKIIFADSVYST